MRATVKEKSAIGAFLARERARAPVASLALGGDARRLLSLLQRPPAHYASSRPLFVLWPRCGRRCRSRRRRRVVVFVRVVGVVGGVVAVAATAHDARRRVTADERASCSLQTAAC